MNIVHVISVQKYKDTQKKYQSCVIGLQMAGNQFRINIMNVQRTVYFEKQTGSLDCSHYNISYGIRLVKSVTPTASTCLLFQRVYSGDVLSQHIVDPLGEVVQERTTLCIHTGGTGIFRDPYWPSVHVCHLLAQNVRKGKSISYNGL